MAILFPCFSPNQASILVQLRKAYYNRKPVEKSRKKKDEVQESDSMQESHLQLPQKEMEKTKPNMKNIHSLMTASFEKRREWIEGLKGRGTVKKIVQQYPGNYIKSSI